MKLWVLGSSTLWHMASLGRLLLFAGILITGVAKFPVDSLACHEGYGEGQKGCSSIVFEFEGAKEKFAKDYIDKIMKVLNRKDFEFVPFWKTADSYSKADFTQAHVKYYFEGKIEQRNEGVEIGVTIFATRIARYDVKEYDVKKTDASDGEGKEIFSISIELAGRKSAILGELKNEILNLVKLAQYVFKSKRKDRILAACITPDSNAEESIRTLGREITIAYPGYLKPEFRQKYQTRPIASDKDEYELRCLEQHGPNVKVHRMSHHNLYHIEVVGTLDKNGEISVVWKPHDDKDRPISVSIDKTNPESAAQVLGKTISEFK